MRLSDSRQRLLAKEHLDINLNQARLPPSPPSPCPLCPFLLSQRKASTGLPVYVTLGEACGAVLAEDTGVKCGVSLVSLAIELSAFNSLFSLLVHTECSYMIH